MSRGEASLSAVLTAALLMALSCKDDPSRTSGSVAPNRTADTSQTTVAAAPQHAAPAPSASASASTKDATNDDASLSRSAVEQLLQRWLAAQNDRSFTDYAATYADRFTGIKRTGSTTSRMNRQDWLDDRKRMFPRIVSVRATNPDISLQPQTASLRFEQHWTSENYQDRGTKFMTIVLEEGQPRIAREELLESLVIGKDEAAHAPVHLVHRVQDKDYLIIGDGAAMAQPELYDGPGTFVALGAVELDKAPGMAGWQGRALRVFSASGKQCSAKAGRVIGIAQALPHFSEQGRWEREKVSESERAKIIADMGAPQFALEIESVSGACGALVLGQAVTQAAPDVAEETEDDAAIRVALAIFRKLPDYQREQRSLDEFFKSTLADKARPQTRWTELEPVNSSQRSFRLGGEHYVWISYTAGPGCGGWDGGLAMLFRVAGGPRPKAIPIPPPKGTSYQTGDVTAVVDTDHDGRVETLLHPTFSAGTLLLDEELKPTEEVRFVSLDCPC